MHAESVGTNPAPSSGRALRIVAAIGSVLKGQPLEDRETCGCLNCRRRLPLHRARFVSGYVCEGCEPKFERRREPIDWLPAVSSFAPAAGLVAIIVWMLIAG